MPSTYSCTTLLVVDSTVSNYQDLISSVSPQTQVALLHADQEGVAQISALLSQYNNIQSLHILSHGEAGQLRLGSGLLTWQTFERYATEIQQWATALAEGADILLYGCRVAAGAIGQHFVRQLSQLTGANVAASANLTGHASLGGDWQLEFTTGRINSPLAFHPEAIAAYSGVLATLNETFTGADVTEKPWLFGVDASSTTAQAQPYLTARPTQAPSANGLQGVPPGTTADPVGDGTLRLTNATTNQAAFVVYNSPVSATGGLEIKFDFYSYGGTGADGITFFLIDGAASPVTAGAFGGSIGYANRTTPITVPGLVGGYLGIAFDEFGNFSNPTEGRIGGPGQTPDSVSVRGSQASGYQYLTGTGTLPFSIDNPGAGATRANSKRTAQIDLTAAGVLTVQVDGNGDGDFADPGEQVITNYDVAAVNGAVPTSFKFGFASGTGDQTNIHEIRNLTINNPPTALDAAVQVRPNTTVNLTGLSATDSDGTIASYTISTLPAATSGTLFLGNPTAGGTAVTAGQILQPGQITQLFFRATSGFSSASFTYTATDNDGKTDPTPATVSLSPDANQPPIARDGSVQIPSNTPTRVTGLAATDTDGTIASFTILTLPNAASGTLFLGNPTAGGTAVRAGQQLTPTQVNQLFFRATDAFQAQPGQAARTDSFTYTATDNLGARDLTPATITLISSLAIGEDISPCKPGRKLRGHETSENLIAGNNSNRIIGFAGNDRIKGRGCNDVIDAGLGSDWVSGGKDDDFIKGQQGDDRLLGDKRNDTLQGGLGSDSMYGGLGSDTIGGGRGSDVIYGQTGKNELRGGLDNDTIYGGRDEDFIDGNNGDDVLIGSIGNDTIQGGLGNDQLNGGAGDDLLTGGRGSDTITGGAGSDQFTYNAATDALDTITDFQVGQDKIVLSNLFAQSSYSASNRFKTYVKVSQSGSNSIVSFDFNGNTAGGFRDLITLLGVSSSSLKANSFVF